VHQWKGNGTVAAALPGPGPEVFLGHIDRVEKEGGVRTKREHAYCLLIHCRDFRHVRFAFATTHHARRPLYERLLPAAFPRSHGQPQGFFAFAAPWTMAVVAAAAAAGVPGWEVGALDQELARQGVPLESGPHGWRVCTLNVDYALSPSYPAQFAVPAAATDNVLTAVARFRSRGRLPVLSWRHPLSGAPIVRCAQPLVGLAGRRSEEDEAYLRMLAATTPPRPARSPTRTSQLSDGDGASPPLSPRGTDTPRLVIVDARPRANAVANQAKGAGFEPARAYPDATLEFYDIANIHVMRASLQQVRALCFPGVDEAHWLAGLHASRWLDHLRLCLVAAVRVATLVEGGTPCLVHCSDGWDRTAQLTSLACLLLDGYYRTRQGFACLVEREWVQMGHRFALRLGHGDRDDGDGQRAPIFLQFLDAVYQLLAQFPAAFEFNSRFLVAVADEAHACRFGTFLYDCERERVAADAATRTPSVWAYLLTPSPVTATFVNPRYRPQTGLLRPATALRRMRVWSDYYVRWTPQVALGARGPLREWQILSLAASLEERAAAMEKDLTDLAARNNGDGDDDDGGDA
jgi:hypothetical protein